MKKLRLGIVGTGFIAPFHYLGFKGCPDAEIVGMCTHSNREKLHRLCADWRIKPYDNFTQLVEDPGIDALIIGSINTEHFSQVMAAQALKKPVLIEKPVVTTLAELDAIQASVARTGVPVVPAHNFIYRSAVRAGREIMRSGALGQVIYASFISNHTISPEHAHGWRSKLALGSGGALMDSGHHQVYQSIGFMGTPVSVNASTSQIVLKDMEGEDTALVQVRYANGAVGTIFQSWTNVQGAPVDGIRIVGTRGSLEISDALYVNDQIQDGETDYSSSFVGQARCFLDIVLKGAPPVSSLEDAKNTLKLILLAYESAVTGRTLAF